MAKALVIVESPAKARTIGGFLDGDRYVVESSIGHIRDLPTKKSEVPSAYRNEPWAHLGIDVDNGFKPVYVSRGRAQEQVRHLRGLLRDGEFDTLYLATDEDREGEAIAWHLLEVLKPAMGSNGSVAVHRMVFHEITEAAIAAAIAEPREIDMGLVNAQEARRCFDRLYGYEMSPVLWRKVRRGLSAGRVQSVANRMIVGRERERIAFVRAGYHSVTLTLTGGDDDQPFSARLRSVNGQPVATGSDFDSQGQLTSADSAVVLDASRAEAIAAALADANLTVSARQSRPYRRSPAAPFITSTLQRAAAGQLGFSAVRTMSAAQRLYEVGRITYMRTDSVTLSGEAISTARGVAAATFGEKNLPQKPRTYKGKARNAQEAHEAIRPAGDRWADPGSVTDLGADAAALYDLIWRRTVGCQMVDATGETVTIRLTATVDGDELEFSTGGTVLTSPGHRLVDGHGPRAGKSAAADDEADSRLPNVAEGDSCTGTSAVAEGHETSPPARYTEASLVAKLEEQGIGRPSTYASILSTIQDRGYVTKRGSALVPEWVAMVTVGLMERHYDSLVDFELTARMEDDLDRIASGELDATPWLDRFYFGPDNGWPGLKQAVGPEFLAEIDARAINGIDVGEDSDGRMIQVRAGRYGAYLRRADDQTRPVPEGLAPDELTLERAVELFAKPLERVVGQDPATGLDVVARTGRFGPYVALGRADDERLEGKRPRMASLLKGWDPALVTLEEALQVLALPRLVGQHPEDGGDITAQNGRYGPYISWARTGTNDDGAQLKPDSRSLDTEEQMFTVTLEGALELLAQPRRRRGQQAALRELGTDPNTEGKVVVKSGRFGPYVTDGTTNATIRAPHDPEKITLETAVDLLAARRAAGPSKRKPAKKRPTAAKSGASRRKAPAKKSPPKRKPAASKPAAD